MRPRARIEIWRWVAKRMIDESWHRTQNVSFAPVSDASLLRTQAPPDADSALIDANSFDCAIPVQKGFACPFGYAKYCAY